MAGRVHGERRANLAELDPALRERLLALDEPVDRSNWTAVVERSNASRASTRRSFALVACGALALALALASALVQRFGEPTTPAAAPLRMTLHLTDGSGVVLYSRAERAGFLDNSDDRPGTQSLGRSASGVAETAAVVRSLSGGPFHVRPALVHDAHASGQPTDAGPLPGDEAFVSFEVFTTPELRGTVGSAVLSCQYGFDRDAYCDGAVDLGDGMRLTAGGTLDAGADHITLAITSSYGPNGMGRGSLSASRPDQI